MDAHTQPITLTLDQIRDMRYAAYAGEQYTEIGDPIGHAICKGVVDLLGAIIYAHTQQT